MLKQFDLELEEWRRKKLDERWYKLEEVWYLEFNLILFQDRPGLMWNKCETNDQHIPIDR